MRSNELRIAHGAAAARKRKRAHRVVGGKGLFGVSGRRQAFDSGDPCLAMAAPAELEKRAPREAMTLQVAAHWPSRVASEYPEYLAPTLQVENKTSSPQIVAIDFPRKHARN